MGGITEPVVGSGSWPAWIALVAKPWWAELSVMTRAYGSVRPDPTRQRARPPTGRSGAGVVQRVTTAAAAAGRSPAGAAAAGRNRAAARSPAAAAGRSR